MQNLTKTGSGFKLGRGGETGGMRRWGDLESGGLGDEGIVENSVLPEQHSPPPMAIHQPRRGRPVRRFLAGGCGNGSAKSMEYM